MFDCISVKCLASVLSKKKELKGVNANAPAIKNFTEIWPCTISFRMPHPGAREGSGMSPEELLRLENNIFVQPYAPHLLSSFLQKGLVWGGWWISTSHIRLWKDFDIQKPLSNNAGGCVLRELSSSTSLSPPAEYHFSAKFVEAYNIAKSDKWVRGYLPPKATSEGSLVNEKYRVQNVGGDAIGGVKYTGAFDLQSAANKRLTASSSRSSSPVPQHKVQIEKLHSLPSISEPTLLPPPIIVNYEHPGVRRLPNSNRWTSVVKIAGNDVFLGTYASQTEAIRARELALTQPSIDTPDSGSKMPSPATTAAQNQAETGLIQDLLITPVEAVISAFEQSNENPKPSFSLQKWLGERHFSPDLQNLMSRMQSTPANKRKKSTPRQKQI
jgi:hypothetical protein